MQFLNNVSSSIGSVMRPAGIENAKGIISAAYLKDPTDPGLKGDPGLKNWTAFMEKYFPEGEQGRHRQRDRATSRPRRWCRCSSSAATTSPART